MRQRPPNPAVRADFAWRTTKLGRKQKVAWLLIMVSLLFIGWMTLVPYPELVEEVRSLPHTCLVCGELGGQDVLLNILLFVPLGVGLGLTGLRRHWALAIIVLTTLAVETLQYTVIVGRHASLSDVLTNSLGGWLGMTLARHARELLLPSPSRARALAITGAIAWLTIQGLTAVLLSVEVPFKEYVVEWAPRLHQYGQFKGTVLKSSLDHIDLASGQALDDVLLRDHLTRDSYSVEAITTPDVAAPWFAPVFSLLDRDENELLLLAQSDRDLFFRVRMRTALVRVRTPALRLQNVVQSASSAPLQIDAGRDQGRLFIRVRCAGKEYVRQLPMSPSWAWSFLIPFEYGFGADVHFLTALWIAGLLAPIGYWARRSVTSQRRMWRVRSLLLVAVVIGLEVIPLLAHFHAVHWSEWLAAALGLLIGEWLASAMAIAPQGRKVWADVL